MSEASIASVPPVAISASARDYVLLMKPRVMSLVVFTAFVGIITAPVAMNAFALICTVLSVALGSGAAGALNMWYDSDIDAKMARTISRPVPAGIVRREDAFGFGMIMSVLSVTLMALASTPLAAALLAFSIFFYVVIYTMWLKRSTAQNIVIGGAAGAFPPMIGWAAATGSISTDAWIMFGLIFLWTPPHFWALSLWTSKEYARAGVPMLPVTRGAKETRLQILLYTMVSAPFGLVPVLTGLGGAIYLAVAILGGVAFLWCAVRIFTSRAGNDDAPADMKHAKRMFAVSIFYLFALFAALMVERILPLHFPLFGGA